MIICNLKGIMKKKNMTLKELSKLTKIHIKTLTKYYNNKIKKIDFKTLSTLCRHLDCETNDIFVII